MPQRRISEIVKGTRTITADTALRLGRFFGTEAQFWLNLQARYDLLVAESELAAAWTMKWTPMLRNGVKGRLTYPVIAIRNK